MRTQMQNKAFVCSLRNVGLDHKFYSSSDISRVLLSLSFGTYCLGTAKNARKIRSICYTNTFIPPRGVDTDTATHQCRWANFHWMASTLHTGCLAAFSSTVRGSSAYTQHKRLYIQGTLNEETRGSGCLGFVRPRMTLGQGRLRRDFQRRSRRRRHFRVQLH
jgi:hypothetical protein